EDGIRDGHVTGVQTCALPISMREGLGTIRIKLRTARGGHELRFENRHLPQVSVYLVNCLAASSDGLVVGRQQRDEAQRSIAFERSEERRVGKECRSGCWACQ